MELQRKDKQELQQELSEFLLQYYDGSFSRMACDYIHATEMTEEEVEALLEAMKDMTKIITKMKEQGKEYYSICRL